MKNYQRIELIELARDENRFIFAGTSNLKNGRFEVEGVATFEPIICTDGTFFTGLYHEDEKANIEVKGKGNPLERMLKNSCQRGKLVKVQGVYRISEEPKRAYLLVENVKRIW